MMRYAIACLLVGWFGQGAFAADFAPDPAAVQRDGPAYRYPQAGWIVVHVEGEPYERGHQQGTLLWREIQGYINCYANQQSGKSPEDAWVLLRTMANALFVRRFDPELVEEMKGIADGAAKAGATFDGRPVDLTDIVAINVWPEIMTLDDALRAEPTGLEGKIFDEPASSASATTRTSRCSAFAATGTATKDGRAIIGHITMFDLYPCGFFNVWLDIKPAKGHRLVLQGGPGSVQSGMDWYINDAGMVLTETTVAQTRFDPAGRSLGSRSRMAMQYGDSVDSMVKILGDSGNGLYTNEWLMADMKTNEIALYELGTKASRLMRSSKNEWFGGTTGFYWGNNNTKDLDVRMETIAANNDRPADMTFWPEPRDMAWNRLYDAYKGKMDADFGKLAFSKPPLVSRNSCDAKYTTADMALQMKSYAHWGNPYGQLWEASGKTLEMMPGVPPIVPNDWTVLTTTPPAEANAELAEAVDLKSDKSGGGDGGMDRKLKPPPLPAWHGTILPASESDDWLASSFAEFEGYVAREKQMIKGHAKDERDYKSKSATQPTTRSSDNGLSREERDELAVRLFSFRSMALGAGSSRLSVPLGAMKADPADDTWNLSATGRGVMLLSELRRRIGAEKFDAAMDAFGRANAGKPVDTKAFVAAITKAGGAGIGDVFTKWLDGTDVLPTLELSAVHSDMNHDGYAVSGRVVSNGGCTPASIDVTVETKDGETTETFLFESGAAAFNISTDAKPTRAVVNKYGQTPILNGWIHGAYAYKRDLEKTLIIYGTRMERDGNRIAAQKLQQGIIDTWEHAVVTIKADTEVSDADLRGHPLLLIGRPACSELIERLATALPVSFGPQSFTVRGEVYANAGSAVVAAAANPLDAHYSMACAAGLSPGATLRAAKSLAGYLQAPIRVMGANEKSKDIVPAAMELVKELK